MQQVYIVVTADSLRLLEDCVNEKITKGYLPYGGVAVVNVRPPTGVWPPGASGVMPKKVPQFYQAMWLQSLLKVGGS